MKVVPAESIAALPGNTNRRCGSVSLANRTSSPIITRLQGPGFWLEAVSNCLWSRTSLVICRLSG
jgi:hypothetical protein